jgi:LysM repeat protein
MTARRILIIVGSLLGLCVVLSVVGWGVLYLARPRGETGPTVIIKEPRNGVQVNTNEMTLVRALATDPIGVVGVELWVDGQLEASARSELETGSSPFPVLEGWEPGAPGPHTLTVRAYNSDGASKHATARVEALDVPRPVPTPMSYDVQQGDTLQTIATGYAVSVEEIAEQNPGLEEPLEPGYSIFVPPPSPEEEDPPWFEEGSPEEIPEEEWPDLSPEELYPDDGPPDPIESIELSPWLSIISRTPFLTIIPPEPMEAALEIEAAFLEVDRAFDGVYCYVSLAGSDTARLPAEGDLESLGGRRWGIETHMGPDNRRIMAIPREEVGLDVWFNCLGYTGSEDGGEVSDLGTLMVTHFSDEWDGRLMELSATGVDGWFRVGYRIWPAGEEPEEAPYPAVWLAPPANLRDTAIFDALGFHYGFVFDYPTGLEEFVDGFLLYRNEAQLPEVIRPRYNSPAADPEYTTWFAEITRPNFYPSCPTTYEFHMVAYREVEELGHIESDPSNSVFIEGDPVPCYESKIVRVTVEQLQTRCLRVDWYLFACVDTCGCGGHYGNGPRVVGGSPDGKIWVNGEEVSDCWAPYGSLCDPGMHCGTSYTMREIGCSVEQSEEWEGVLGAMDDLTASMKWWDYDVWSGRDKFCAGDYTIGHWELDDIAKLPEGERTRTYEPEYNGGPGECSLKFTVEVVAEAAPLPSVEP